MGNRATVIFTDESEESISPAVYLHWNGGADSIYAFLAEMDKRDIRNDQCYECARFIHIVGDFFDQETITGLSLGVVDSPKTITPEHLSTVKTDHGDNGFYIIHRGEDGIRMKRFIEGHKDGKYFLEELTPEQIKQERESIQEFLPRFAEMFDKIRGSKKID